MDVLMQWGDFQFTLSTLAYDQLTRQTAYRWVAMERINRPVAQQFTGPGAKAITLRGVICSQIAGVSDGLAKIRELADRATPATLTAGGQHGKVFGKYVLTSISEDQSYFLPGGQDRKNSVSLQFEEYGEDRNGEALWPGSKDLSIFPRSVLSVGSIPSSPPFSSQAIGTLVAGLDQGFLSKSWNQNLTPGNLTTLALPLSSVENLPPLVGAMGQKPINQTAIASFSALGVRANGLESAFQNLAGDYGIAVALQRMSNNPALTLQQHLQTIAPGLEDELKKWVDRANRITGPLMQDQKIANYWKGVIVR